MVAGAASFDYGADDSSLPIGDDVIIDGDNRITVRGTSGGRVFETKYSADPTGFRAEDVTFSNITITNGGGDDRGGGIFSRARNLTLDNVTLDANFALTSGGGLHHEPYYNDYDKSVSIIGSTLTGNFTTQNVAGGSGGGAYIDMKDGGPVLIASSDFSNNFATGGNGGALNVLSQDFSEMTVKYNSFSNNRAKYAAEGNGGAVFADVTYASPSFSGPVIFFDNQFADNQAQGLGGGVYLIEQDGQLSAGRSQLHR